MDTQLAILKLLDESCRKMSLSDYGDITWEHGQQIRSIVLRGERGDSNVWSEFLDMVREDPKVASGFHWILGQLGIVWYSIYHEREMVSVPSGMMPFTDKQESELLAAFGPKPDAPRTPSYRPDVMSGDVMYVEWKPGLAGHARIGRVRKSGSGKTLYYFTYVLTSLKGQGYKANYVDTESGMQFWVSNCRKDGNDTLYPGTIDIDPNAREEYWLKIRQMPENINVTSFRSEGKYSKRRPR